MHQTSNRIPRQERAQARQPAGRIQPSCTQHSLLAPRHTKTSVSIPQDTHSQAGQPRRATVSHGPPSATLRQQLGEKRVGDQHRVRVCVLSACWCVCVCVCARVCESVCVCGWALVGVLARTWVRHCSGVRANTFNRPARTIAGHFNQPPQDAPTRARRGPRRAHCGSTHRPWRPQRRTGCGHRCVPRLLAHPTCCQSNCRIPFGDHPLKLERYRED